MLDITNKVNDVSNLEDYEFNNHTQELENSVKDANQPLSVSNDNVTQSAIAQTVKSLTGMSFNDISSTPNNVDLEPVGASLLTSTKFQMPLDWFNGMRFKFKANNTSTSSVQVRFKKNDGTYTDYVYLKNSSGVIVGGDEIVVNSYYEIFYNGTDCILMPWTESASTSSLKNPIINSRMEIAQLVPVTGLGDVGSDEITLDRYLFYKADGTTPTVIDFYKDTDIATYYNNLNNNMRISVTTGSTPAAAEYSLIEHRIEGYNFKQFDGRNCLLSFKVKSPVFGIHCVTFRNQGNDRTYITEYDVQSANTWEEHQVLIPFNETGGTWNYTNDVGIKISWILATGINFNQGTKDTWLSDSAYLSTSNQVNVIQTGYNFYLTDIQLETSSVVTTRDYRSFEQELSLCQRYLEKSYDLDKIAGIDTSNNGLIVCENTGAATNNIAINVPFLTRKRTQPSITLYETTADTTSNVGERSFTASRLTERIIQFHYLAECELTDV